MAAANLNEISNHAVFEIQHLVESSNVLSAPCSKKRNNDAISDAWGAAPPPAIAPRVDARTVYFYRRQERPFGCFSNWSKHGLTHKGIWFVSSEQAYMWEKAMTFDDLEMCDRIRAETEPWDIKKLGRAYNIRNYQKEVWNALKYDVMFNVLIAKFSQNLDLLALLLATGAAELAEASPSDPIWGIGFDAENAEANRGRWGRNLLGHALVAVRVHLGGQAVAPMAVPAVAPAAAAAAPPAEPAPAMWRRPVNMCVHCKVKPRYRHFVFCGRTCRAEWVAQKYHK